MCKIFILSILTSLLLTLSLSGAIVIYPEKIGDFCPLCETNIEPTQIVPIENTPVKPKKIEVKPECDGNCATCPNKCKTSNSVEAPVEVEVRNYRSNNMLYMFTASWCEPCKTVKPVVKELEADGYRVLVYDIDLCKQRGIDLSRYGLKNVPTLTINKSVGYNDKGQELFLEVKRFIGITEKQTLQNALDKEYSNE